MNIPETVRIGSIDYKIELTKAPIVLDYKQCNGIIDYTQSKIILDSNTLEQQQLELTLLHEIVHGMLHDRGLEEQSNESLVDAIAYALHQLIRDNHSLFEKVDIITDIDLKEEDRKNLEIFTENMAQAIES